MTETNKCHVCDKQLTDSEEYASMAMSWKPVCPKCVDTRDRSEEM